MALFATLLYYPEDSYWTNEKERQFSAGYGEFGAAASAAGVLRGGEALHPPASATTITVAGDKGGDVVMTDGPYAEAAEVLGGFYLIDVADLDAAIEWAAQIPAAWRGKGRGPAGRADGRPERVGRVTPEERLADTARMEGRRVLATLIRALGDLQRAEDAVQDAVVAALRAWPRSGVPDNPRAWLTLTARRKAYDAPRRDAGRGAKETAAAWAWPVVAPDPSEEVMAMFEAESVVNDDLLRLVSVHLLPPGPGPRRVGGVGPAHLVRLDVASIARALLVEEATMAKRLVRAWQKIAAAHIPYRVPTDAELPSRPPAVLAVVYLIATEAHRPSDGDQVARVDLEVEAVGLARLLVELMPGEPEVLSLLALLLFTAARRPARVDDGGDAVLLADQDRRRWDRAAIKEGLARRDEAVRWSSGIAGAYQLQAHLAACHCTAPTWAETDWDRIVGLYDLLLTLAPNPAVALNRAVAVSERDGPDAGMVALDAIDGLSKSHLWHAGRGQALRRLGRVDEADDEVWLAIQLAPTEPDRRLLHRRLAIPPPLRESDG